MNKVTTPRNDIVITMNNGTGNPIVRCIANPTIDDVLRVIVDTHVEIQERSTNSLLSVIKQRYGANGEELAKKRMSSSTSKEAPKATTESAPKSAPKRKHPSYVLNQIDILVDTITEHNSRFIFNISPGKQKQLISFGLTCLQFEVSERGLEIRPAKAPKPAGEKGGPWIRRCCSNCAMNLPPCWNGQKIKDLNYQAVEVNLDEDSDLFVIVVPYR